MIAIVGDVLQLVSCFRNSLQFVAPKMRQGEEGAYPTEVCDVGAIPGQQEVHSVNCCEGHIVNCWCSCVKQKRRIGGSANRSGY